MKLSTGLPLLVLAGTALALRSNSPAHQNQNRVLHPRAPTSDDPLDIANFLADNFEDDDLPIGFQSSDADGQKVILYSKSNSKDVDAAQTKQCKSTIFITSATNGGSKESGWETLPEVTSFNLKRDLVIDAASGARQPYYELAGRDPAKVKRVLIVQPGLPRDSWKYANLFRNALICAAANETIGVKLEDVIIAGPAWVNQEDLEAGAALETDVIFNKGQWAFGAISKGPGDLTTSSYSVLDALVEHYFDKAAYPNVNQIYVAGHSLGGLLVQHYAMIRKPTRDEPNINFWMGNPGSYAWPVDDRPAKPAKGLSCKSTHNTWPYGMANATEDDVPTYRRSDMLEDADKVKDEYFARHVVYALGLEDHGNGDDHCEAHYQGASHLERGQNMEKALESLPGGKPKTHIFNYVPGVSHMDYPMLSSPDALWDLFGEDLDVRRETKGSKSGNRNQNANTSTNNSGSGSNKASGGSTPASVGSVGASSPSAALSRPSLGSLLGVLAGSLALLLTRLA